MFYSSPDNKGIHLDKKLNDIFKNKTNGFFIELGGYDGITQSNTCFFEKELNWSGILIEPSINQYNKCKINRPNSIVLNYACVSDDYDKSTILIDNEEYLMTSIDGKRRNVNKENLVAVQTSTLNKILSEYINDNQIIDFLSLDVEGYELEVLKGLNLQKYRPIYLLIEVYNTDYDNLVAYLLQNNYKLVCNFSNYNKLDNPVWDETHNDYLFTIIS
jgi:FkbM family methyltransferase